MKLFGTSGIRGIINKDVDTKLAMALGNSVGSLYQELLIGYDTRASNLMLFNAVASGALLSGAVVNNAGLVPTPTLATTANGFDCGIMVTASHNPPEYNGIKLWNPDGSAFDTSQMEKVEDSIFGYKFKKVGWKEIKPIKRYDGAIQEHIEKILSTVVEAKIKVVVDCFNGAASVVTPYMLQKMGCDVVAINSEPHGSFHGKTPEPTEENLRTLKSFVRTANAHLGIAHDGDGDRMVAIDEKGNYVGGDKLLSLFCGLEAIKSVVIPFDASMAIEDHLKHIRVHRCKVGDVFVAETIKKTGADFGGEPSGTYIFPKHSMCPDGIFAAAKLVEIVKKNKLSKLVGKIPSYPTIKKSIIYDKSKKKKVMKNVSESIEAVRSKKLERMDGTKLVFEDAWSLIRFSGTEPKIRLVVESKTNKRAKQIYQKLYYAVNKAIKKAG